MKIYADHAATTPMSSRAKETMLHYMDTVYGNPSSLHTEGQRAMEALTDAHDTGSAELHDAVHHAQRGNGSIDGLGGGAGAVQCGACRIARPLCQSQQNQRFPASVKSFSLVLAELLRKKVSPT